MGLQSVSLWDLLELDPDNGGHGWKSDRGKVLSSLDPKTLRKVGSWLDEHAAEALERDEHGRYAELRWLVGAHAWQGALPPYEPLFPEQSDEALPLQVVGIYKNSGRRKDGMKVAQIRSHPDYSADAKRRYIQEAYEEAQAEYRESVEIQEQEIQERVSKAERALFETPYPYAVSDVEEAQLRALRRGAYDGVYNGLSSLEPGEAREELDRLLARAERTGGPELADAVYHVATERGKRGVADAYLEKRPKAQRRWEEFVAAQTEAESVERRLGHAVGFGLMRPPELG